MSQKLFKNGCFLILAAYILVAPFQSCFASVFNSQSVVDLVNNDRANLNIPPLKVNQELTQAATGKANDMILHNYFAHVSPDGITPWQWIGRSGYDYLFAGENLAINFADPQSQHDAFMKSESHKKNILNIRYKEIGVAVITGKINGKQTIVTVQEFGAKANELPVEKAVAGAASNKNLIANSTTLTDNSQKSSYPNFSSAGKVLTTMSEKLSPVPLVAFLYISSMLIALSFFFYELFAAHFQLATHFFSLFKRLSTSQIKKLKAKFILLPTKLVPPAHFKKTYLIHMKLKR